jgi:pSer/pThr/pTyr-binding forkhead associated (FHA) protein
VSLEGAIVSETALAKPLFVVGRHPDCDLVIEHPAVSGRHMVFRTVGATVYAEDLASTNGVLVNGVAAESQVIHHLDVIEIGEHKLHFFDDALLAVGVRDLESTVLTDFERTVLAANVPAAPARPAAGSDGLSRTMAISRGEAIAAASSPPVTDREAPALALNVLSGEGQGGQVRLERTNTMIGHAGADTALVVRRGQSFFIARLAGNRALRLNGRELGPGTHPIAMSDVIEVGRSRFEVVRANRETAVEPGGDR